MRGRPVPSERLKKLIERARKLCKEKRRVQYAWRRGLIYFWVPSTYVPVYLQTKTTGQKDELISLGDHLAVVRVDYPFPGELPSWKKGLKWDPINWAEDYACVLDNSPAEIYPDEWIVGEFHWQLEDLRDNRYPKELDEAGLRANELGAGGTVFTHTCPDLSILLTQGWGGILKRIEKSYEKWKDVDKERAQYLQAAKIVCESIIRFIKRHAERARLLAASEKDEERKENYITIARICEKIATEPPSTFREAVQLIWFAIIADRIMGHANGYGRLDQLLYPFYKKDIEEGRINREQARELIAELLLKYTGTYFSIGGRTKDGKDAVNELSWIILEAYDMIGGIQTLGVMWHSDIDEEFFEYACEVLARHGGGVPTLVNYDVMKKSLLYYGYDEEDAWNVSYSGCHWYCVPGKEYSNHDQTCFYLPKCLMRALDRAVKDEVNNFDRFLQYYFEEVERTAYAFNEHMNNMFKWKPKVWPEIPTSLLCHGPIEEGRDVSDCGVKYNIPTVNVIGLANVVDSLYAIKKLVFEERKLTLRELHEAVRSNFKGYEDIHKMLNDLPKFGNDIDEVDEIAKLVVDHVRDVLWNKIKCIKGTGYRASFFSFMAHAVANTEIGATPDGRKAEEPLAQGPNPMHGRARNGITAAARSIAKLGFDKLAGGPFNLELDPSNLDTSEVAKILKSLATSFFKMGGVQIVANIISYETLKAAMENPDQYSHIVVRITAQSTYFVNLDRKLQEEILARTRFRSQ